MSTLRFAVCIALATTILGFACLGSGPAAAQAVDELEKLNQRVIQLYQAGKYAEAVPLADRYAEGVKARHGADAPQYAIALNNLAQLLQATNRLAEAEELMRRVLVIDENNFGPDHTNVARNLGNLAELLRATNRLDRG